MDFRKVSAVSNFDAYLMPPCSTDWFGELLFFTELNQGVLTDSYDSKIARKNTPFTDQPGY